MLSTVRLVIASVSIALLGCVTGSKPPDPKKLVKGVTTHQQVIAKYGPPRREAQHPDGTRLLQYFTHYYVQLSSLPPDVGALHSRGTDILIAPSGVVSNVHFSTSRHPVVLRDDYAQSGPIINEEKLRQIIPNKTTRAELLKLFGKPYIEHLHLENGLVLVWLHARYHPGFNQTYLFLEATLDQSNIVIGHRTSGSSHFAPTFVSVGHATTARNLFSSPWLTPPPSTAIPNRN